jgi:hypothetical protein
VNVVELFSVEQQGCEYCRTTTIDETLQGGPFKVGDSVLFVFAPTESGVITKVRPGGDFPYWVTWDNPEEASDDGWYGSSHLLLIERR